MRLASRITYVANRRRMQTVEAPGHEGFVDSQPNKEASDDSEPEAVLQSILPTLAVSRQEF